MALAGLLIHCCALIIDEKSPFANTRDKSTINVSIIDSPLKKPRLFRLSYKQQCNFMEVSSASAS